MYELTDLYLDHNGEEIVLTASEDTLSTSMAQRHGVFTSTADSEPDNLGLDLGWDVEGDSVDDTVTNVGDVLSSMGEYLLYCLCLSFIPVPQD